MENEAIPAMAKALWYDEHTNKLSIRPNHPIPKPDFSAGEHLIRVHTFSPTAGELAWPAEQFPNPLKEPIPAHDVAGTIVLAPADSPFQPGTEVLACTGFDRTGCAREYCIALTKELAQKPPGMSWESAASVPLSALTAWQALFEHAELEPVRVGGNLRTKNVGNRVLVTAASGGVGTWLIQFASIAGCDVIGTCGTDNVGFVQDLGSGVRDVIDYRKKSLQEWIEEDETRKVDVVVDCVGGKSLEAAWTCLKGGGKLLTIIDPPENKKPEGYEGDVGKSLFFIVRPDGEQLRHITQFVMALPNVCKPVLDGVWKFEEYDEAYKRLNSGHSRGKVVIKF